MVDDRFAPQETLEGFKQAVAQIWLRDGQNTWPVDLNTIAHLFMDIFALELLEDIRQLKAAGLPDEAVARKFKTAARIVRLIMPLVLGMKATGMPVDQVRQHVSYLLSLVGLLKSGTLLNPDGRNLILFPGQVQEAIGGQAGAFEPAGLQSSRLLHRLCGILWNYAETVCFKTHGLIREFHGPYPGLQADREILVRDFFLLRATDLWPECRAVPVDTIRVKAVYQGLDMGIDIYNNVSTRPGGSFVQALVSFSVEADGQTLPASGIEELCRLLSGVMMAIAARVEKFTWQALTEKYAEIFWFSKKELRDELGRDWRPPVAIKERIDRGLPSQRLARLGPDSLQRLLRVSF